MNTTIEHSNTGGFRFNHHEPLPIGKRFLHIGQPVKLIGPGRAGMPEVESEDGSTCYAFPHDLKPLADAPSGSGLKAEESQPITRIAWEVWDE